MSQQIYQVTYRKFTLTVYDNCISITKKGSLLGMGTNPTARGGYSAAGGEKRIFYSAISSVQYRKPTKLDYGEIIFDFPGAPRYVRNSGETGFLFSKIEAPIMEKAYEYIQNKIDERYAPQGATNQSAAPIIQTPPVANSEMQAPPMPRQNIGIHVLLFCFTGGIGNIFYALSISKSKKKWQELWGK